MVNNQGCTLVVWLIMSYSEFSSGVNKLRPIRLFLVKGLKNARGNVHAIYQGGNWSFAVDVEFWFLNKFLD